MQGQNDIAFQVAFGISLIDAISENSFSDSQKTTTAICNGCIRQGWIEEYLGNGPKIRQEEWTDSIAVGSRTFIEKVNGLLGFRAKN